MHHVVNDVGVTAGFREVGARLAEENPAQTHAANRKFPIYKVVERHAGD